MFDKKYVHIIPMQSKTCCRGKLKLSLFRWATFNNPKAPWKQRVIRVAETIGVKEAARKFKVATSKIELWMRNSRNIKQMEKKEENDNDDDKKVENDGDSCEEETDHENNEDHDHYYEVAPIPITDMAYGDERCDVCEKLLYLGETMLEHIVSEHLDSCGNTGF